MPKTVRTYLEAGRKRVFAGALDWPGWCRAARDEEGALAALADYGARYRDAVAAAAPNFGIPGDASALKVVERLKGNATTDFGAPAIAPKADSEPLAGAELERQVALLRACWAALDAAARDAAGAVLRKGPRGGGRELRAIVAHVTDAERAYLSKLGGRYRKAADADADAERDGLRAAIVDTLESLGRGEPPARTPRSGSLWSPRYFVRRSAWHALDHAWEIQDRA
jgi:DinB superfamily